MSDAGEKKCKRCTHLIAERLYDSLVDTRVAAVNVSCTLGHRLLRPEERIQHRHVFSSCDLEIYKEHLILHVPDYDPAEDPKGSIVAMTLDGLAGGEGRGEAMWDCPNCPDWKAPG